VGKRNEKRNKKSVVITGLLSLPDPLSLYVGLTNKVDLSTVAFNKPEICNTNGLLIHPHDYATKLQDYSFVGVEVLLKLYVLHIPPLYFPYSWNISSKQSTNESRSGGFRTYQLILQKLLILPNISISKQALISALPRVADSAEIAKVKEVTMDIKQIMVYI
jgi:hypothetical protein